MIERQHNKVIFICDLCEDDLDTDRSDFGEANAIRKDEGWHALQVKDDWEHRCPSCVKKGASGRRVT